MAGSFDNREVKKFMCCKGFFKRVVPFFLTFAAGLFIASFFVSVAAPTFQFKNRGWRGNHRQYDRQREAEIQQLREENRRLKNALSTVKVDKFTGTYQMNGDGNAKLLEYEATINGERIDDLVPPPAPLAPSKLRMETVPYQGK